jgi:hypothetical protein
MAELLAFPGEDLPIRPENLVSASHRVGLLKGESVCGVSSFTRDDPEQWSIRTVSECIISSTPIDSQQLLETFQMNMALNLQVLRALRQRIDSALFLAKNYRYLWHKLASIADSIALALPPESLGKQGEEEPTRETSDLPTYAGFLQDQAKRLEQATLAPWDANHFLDRIQEALGLYAEHDQNQVESVIDYPQYLFLKRLISKDDKTLAKIFSQDEPSNFYVFQFFSLNLATLLNTNMTLVQSILLLTSRLFGPEGWVLELERISALYPGHSSEDFPRFLSYLQRFSWRCRVDGLKLLGKDIAKDYPGFKFLVSRGVSGQGSSQSSSLAAPGDGSPARLDKYNGLLVQILGFAELGQDFNQEFTELIQQFSNLPDKLSATKPVQQLRSQITSRYWKLYETCFLKVIDSDLRGFVPGIMLHLGLVDERLVSPDELIEIDRIYSQALSIEQPIPVMSLPYFLEKIYTGTVQPSINEMGEGFAETLRLQKKSASSKKSKHYEYKDTPEDRVRWELNTIAPALSRMLAGNRQQAIPILCSEVLQGGALSQLFQEPQKVSSHIDLIHSRDFSLFHRETVCRHKFGSDLVKKQVLPNIVLYPSAGTRMMMWQEIEGTRKDSPGRIMLPIFFSGQQEKSLTFILAHLRWELSRVVAGPNWMDAVEGGLSGAYYDYLAFYKKNPHLSPAHKEKIREFITKTRTERERFALDYYTWVIHEYEDKVRLNSVARDIFYRFCPFPKERREEMAKRPLLSDLDMKYNIRVRKEILKLESRFKRFERAGEPIPEDMRAYMDYLNG